MHSSSESVLFEARGRVGLITLNRPDVGNAINEDIRLTLPALLKDIDRDDAFAAIVLAGSGERGFCVGADIKEARLIGSSVQERRRLLGNPWIDRIGKLSKPLVAAIHGYCLGGGLEIALACDLRMASPDAQFSLPETGLGLIPGGGGTQRLPRIIGIGRALDLLLTGDRVDAQEALRIGLVSRLAQDRAGLTEEALVLATRIAARPPSATAYVKEAARSGLEMELDAGLRLEKTLFSLLMSTADRAEAAVAFREKRAPQFSGN